MAPVKSLVVRASLRRCVIAVLSFCLLPPAVRSAVAGSCVPSCLNGGVCFGTVCDCTGTGYTGTTCDIPEGTIINCIPEAVAGLSWKPPPVSTLVSQVSRPCIGAYDSLRAGSITRTCNNGTWSLPDYSQCLLDTEQAFMLIWIPLNISNTAPLTAALPALKTEVLRIIGLNDSFQLDFVRSVEISGPISYISATFVLLLSTMQPSDEIQNILSESTFEFGANINVIGGLPAAADAPWGVRGFFQSNSCYCRQEANQLFLGLCEEIVPIPACTLNATDNTFKCFFPYFIGDGEECTIDEDGDGFPNVPLEICVTLSNTNASFCTPDNCPSIYNPSQDITKCVAPPGFSGCKIEEDEVWEISWGNTLKGQTDRQRCPRGPGFTTRFCGPGGWEPAVASECGSYQFSLLEDDIFAAFDDDDLESRLLNSADIFQDIRAFTNPVMGGRVSILPSDLDTTNRLVNIVLELLEEIQEGEIQVNIPNFSVLDILSNVLTTTNLNGWISLQDVASGSRQLLDISERYGLYLSRTVDDDDNDRRLMQRENLILGFKNANPDMDGDQMFPETEDDVNGTFTTIPAQIMIPRSFLQEQMTANRTSVSVSTILYRNMEQALPVTINNTQVASMVLSAQVSQRNVLNAASLLVDPVVMKFVFDAVENATNYKCAFWQFSNPIGSGSWRTEGVSKVSQEISSDGKTVTLFCNATHLTSFAVLVDLTGSLNPGGNGTGIPPSEFLALQIVSYIGCIISLICLLATIIFFVILGKEIFQKVHYFIHLNLAVVLFLAYLMFVVGIEPAKANKGACVFVAVWLHYFFLSSFSWMLCEGIMLYLMLVVVFSKLAKKWWFFLIVGYGLPVIPVVVTLGVRLSDYGVYGADGTLNYCWLSTNNGVIWAFVGPMLAIIMVNLVFMVIALVTVYKSTHQTVKRTRTLKGESESMNMSEKRTLFSKLFVATLVLLPLLGVTWILGIFAVNTNTTLFAWLFTIVNSLQGLFIFFFHVLRSDKVWKSPRAKAMKNSINKRFTSTSYQKEKVNRFKSNKTSSTSNILSTEASSNEKYTLSNFETSQVDSETTPPRILEEGVEIRQGHERVESKAADNGRVDESVLGSEENLLNGDSNNVGEQSNL